MSRQPPQGLCPAAIEGFCIERKDKMTTENTFLAIFTGSKDSPRMKAWNALSEADRKAREQKGMADWQAWMARHGAALVFPGGPLGKTRRVSPAGIEDVTNDLAVFVVVRADSHEAAARLFEGHPHITAFPGEAIEVMPILPVPTR
jgi:hypothetical protein